MHEIIQWKMLCDIPQLWPLTLEHVLINSHTSRLNDMPMLCFVDCQNTVSTWWQHRNITQTKQKLGLFVVSVFMTSEEQTFYWKIGS